MAGWNGSDRRGNSTPVQPKVAAKKKPSPVRGLIAGGLVCFLAVGAYFAFFAGLEKPQTERVEKDRGRIKEVTPAKAPKAKPAPAKEKPVEEAETNKFSELWKKLGVKPQIKVREISPEEWYRLTNRTFRTGLEQTMSIMFSTEPGDMVLPPFPMSDEDKKDIVAILISKNEVTDKDDEMTAICKQQVDRAKKEMAKYIGDGGDPEGFLNYYFQELRLAFDKRNDAIDQLRETKEEDPELAEELRQEINKKFEEDGIKPINKEAY